MFSQERLLEAKTPDQNLRFYVPKYAKKSQKVFLDVDAEELLKLIPSESETTETDTVGGETTEIDTPVKRPPSKDTPSLHDIYNASMMLRQRLMQSTKHEITWRWSRREDSADRDLQYNRLNFLPRRTRQSYTADELITN